MKEILQYLCTWKFWKELFIMTLGMAIAAAAVYYFMMPGKLVLGSISGLSIVISNLANAKELAYDEILFLLGTDGSYAFELVNQEGSLGVVPFEKALYDDCAVKFGATIPALRDDPAVVVDLAYVLQKVSAEAQKTGVNVN